MNIVNKISKILINISKTLKLLLLYLQHLELSLIYLIIHKDIFNFTNYKIY